MGYEEFKEKILEKLQDFYGNNADVNIERQQKNNGIYYDGILIRTNGTGSRVALVIRLDELYEEYNRSDMDIWDCVQDVLRILNNNKVPKGIERLVQRINDWDYVRKSVYPILLSTEGNRELLQKLVSTAMLDLSVVYIIRTEMANDCGSSIKISKSLMENYGISIEQLHEQAMENLKKDGYKFQNIYSVVRSLLPLKQSDEYPMSRTGNMEMHVLTNSSNIYGAAGILDRELLKQFAGEQDYIILPSSVHETIFVPVTEKYDKETFDSMIVEVNQSGVSREEWLSNHSYYYDAGIGEIRICA